MDSKFSGNEEALVRSPVPLSREEAQNEEVRKLAAKLMPALEEADALLVVPQEFQGPARSTSQGYDDDSMDDELDHLELSEALLRQELELASDFSNLFQLDTPNSKSKSFSEDPPEQVPLPKGFQAEAEEPNPVEPLTLDPIKLPSPLKPNQNEPEPYNIRDDSAVLLTAGPLSTAVSNPLQPYTYKEHFERLGIQLTYGWYGRDLSEHLTGATSGTALDFCLALPESKLKSRWIGLKPEEDLTPLPVRTWSFAMRPDVLCGAIMDGVHQALTSGLQAKILKRQGGHLRGVVAGCVVPPPERLLEDSEGQTPAPLELPAFSVDAQLCTTKSDNCERALVIRIYHVSEEDQQDEDITRALSSETGDQRSFGTGHYALAPELNLRPAELLRETCALVQRLEAPDSASLKKIKSPSKRLSNRASMQQTVSQHLLQNYRACPSSKNGGITLPSLNNTDWPVILSSSRLLSVVWDELETRDLTMSTLQTCRFGAFPALPTLDVHYCSQMRRYSREMMICQLLKSASELEEYARTSEFNCASMINMLEPTFENYDLEMPGLPEPVPLNEYPLDFVPPQQACPPWGSKVMEALNQIQAEADVNNVDNDVESSSLETAQKAVHRVLQAFTVQDDEEKGARLGRKNMQVMDRLAKMQAHQQTLIQSIQNGRALSAKARQAATDFATKIGSSGDEQVPLLEWTVVVGSYSGTMTVSSQYIVFCTRMIPILGGTSVTKFSLSTVDFAVEETTPSIMNPLPTMIHVRPRRRDEGSLSFRPSSGATRLVNVLRSIQDTMAAETNTPPASPMR